MARAKCQRESKRIPTRLREKIKKKVAAHSKKERRNAKKNGKTHRPPKDPGVPNSFPLKEQVLREAEEAKRKAEEQRQKKREQWKIDRKKMANQKRNLGSLIQDAQKKTDEFDRKNAFVQEKSKEYTSGRSVEQSLKQYYKEFKRVIDAADVIIEVLDARDPMGSRCTQVEEAVLSAGAGKKLVLMLNKIDLIPKENAEKWLKYLRNEFPAIAFKASTQTQKDNLAQSKVPVNMASDDLRKSSRCLGADMLLKLLGNYCRNQDIKTAITVGVVGFPNTGKSSIINSLKRSKACSVGATPGVTKQMQEVQLDKHVKLLDSPGVVMAAGDTDAATILKNCVKVETIDDPTPAVAAILRRCNKDQLMLHYNIPEFTNVQEFLALLAKRFGRLKKGGVPDAVKAGKQVLQDWNMGKITYYTHPPEQHTMPTHLSADIITSMTTAFDIDALLADEEETLKDLKLSTANDIVISSETPTSCVIADEEMEDSENVAQVGNDDGETENMDDGGEETTKDEGELAEATVKATGKKKKGKKTPDKKKAKVLQEDTLSDNNQLNKARKVAFKKLKKERKRADNLGNSLGDALEGAFAGLGGKNSDDYDFNVDFK